MVKLKYNNKNYIFDVRRFAFDQYNLTIKKLIKNCYICSRINENTVNYFELYFLVNNEQNWNTRSAFTKLSLKSDVFCM